MKAPKHFRPEPFAYHEVIELEIDSLSNLGAGVGRINRPTSNPEHEGGWVVFVPFCLPGELVKARIWKNETSCSHADLIEVISASADRKKPRCPLFTTCGGCQYQHISYERQLKEKTQHVKELMQKLGDIEFPVALSHASPQVYNYRSKITPHYNRPDREGSQPIGFL